MVTVIVHGALSGERLELVDLDSQKCIMDLKHHIAQHWQIDCRAQKLLIDTGILEDSEVLAAHCLPGSSILSVTILKSWDSPLEHDLLQGSSSRKMGVLQELLISQSDINEHIIAAIVACLEDNDRHVRNLAIDTLKQVVRGCDDRLRLELSTRLQHRDHHVRRAAILALTNLAEHDGEFVISAVAPCAADDDRDVRRAVVKALSKTAEITAAALASASKDRILEVLTLLTDDQDVRVKTKSMRALGIVAGSGDQRFKAAMTAHLEVCADWTIRMGPGA